MKSKIVTSFFLILSIIIMIVITTTVTSLTNSVDNELSEDNLEEMLSTLYKDISTYVQIEHIYGKYTQTEHSRMITQIALQIKPYFSTEIPVDRIVLQILGNHDIQTLYYSGSSSPMMSSSLFDNPIWNNTTATHFSIMSLFDFDSSIEENNLINDFSDRMYILVRLNKDQWINNHMQPIEINIFFESGVSRHLSLQVPFSTKDIIQIL